MLSPRISINSVYQYDWNTLWGQATFYKQRRTRDARRFGVEQLFPWPLSSWPSGALLNLEDLVKVYMTIKSDPENNEIHALFDLVDFSRKVVLEIGCGDGRLTRRYAEAAIHVTGIDPFEESIQRANANQPDTLRDRVVFYHIALEDFAATRESELFDIAILSWSL
jgi:2-polyprenyl-3-methyl-5-hydroxy-6-metoxy-1,4-benzoquinol methylase